MLQDSKRDSQMVRYDRQILIENWNQTKIRESKIVIVGLGALGTVAATSLTMAGVGELILVDHDTIEISNLNRQLLFRAQDVGKSKVDIAAKELKKINSDIEITSLNHKVQEVPLSVLENTNAIIEGLDTFHDRRWVNSFIIEKGIPLISGGIFGFLGNLQVVIPRESACLECQSLIPEEELQEACTPFGDIRKQEREKTAVEKEIPSVSSVSFVIGGLIAQEALKVILELPTLKEYLFWDGKSGTFTAIELARREDCFVCSSEYSLNAIPIRTFRDQTTNEFLNQLRYSFNLSLESTMLVGTKLLESTDKKLAEFLNPGDILRVIDTSLAKPLKFIVLLDF
ncbi:MAG: HesA/MoeB/ThiF family protein [Candidatus Hodarchaeales archaeon]|jgi:sulfur carrier protein ThiS adenylyltransferase